MEKIFVVDVNSFELKMVARMLKRNNKNLIIMKRDGFGLSDQISKKIENAIKKQKQIIFIGCEPEAGEWVERFGEDAPKYKTIEYRYEYGREKSILRRTAEIVAQDVLDDFEKVVVDGVEDHIFSMGLMAGHLGYPEKAGAKMAKNILKGKALYNGTTKKAWKDAEIAVQNKKKIGDLTVVEYDHEDYDPIADLAYGQYNNLLIVNRKKEGGLLLTYNHDLVQVVQASAEETWTYRRDGRSKYRVTISGHLSEVEEAVKRYFVTC